MLQTEALLLSEFLLVTISIMINVNFLNTKSGARLIEHFVELDVLLGADETKFMRNCMEVFAGITCITIGTLFGVQTLIEYAVEGKDMMKKSIVFGWVFLSWLVILIWSALYEFVPKQINQTKLICTYAQLTQSQSDEILELSKNVLCALEVRQMHMCLYGLFSLEVSKIFSFAAAILVYVTAQLQICMIIDEPLKQFNTSSSVSNPV
ncbi:hypothetical protein ACJJTC_017779 [Scirpophaga incertulas]